MRLLRPELLLLLASVIWFWRTGNPAQEGSGLRRLVRAATVVLLIGGVSGLQIRRGDSPLNLIVALDRSDSMTSLPTPALGQVRALTQQMRQGDRAGLVVFGANAAVERRLSGHLDVESVTTRIAGAGTNIEDALRTARSALPTDGSRRILLLSDGQQTSGDALVEARRAAVAGVPIDVVIPTNEAVSPRLEVSGVTAPATAKSGEPFDVVVTAQGVPGTRGMIELQRPGEALQQDVTVPSDGTVTVRFSERPTGPGIQLYEATARSRDTADFGPEQPLAGAVVVVADQPRVLYVGGSPASLQPALTSAGFRVQHVAASALSPSSAMLGQYDAVVLDDIIADQLDAPRVRGLRAFVEQHGGGILMLGGPDSLEPGLLAGNALGDLLPVDFRPRSGQRAPTLALIIAFDKSGSMDDRVDGVPRIEFARQAVRRVFDAVPSSDAVGVIAFDAAAQVVAPLRPGQDAPTLSAALASVQPGGATAIAPAMALAAEWLREPANGTIPRRHVLLVSDGRTSAADAARLRAVVQAGGFELSVVALGADADRRFLESLAQLTGGRAYFPNDIRELPVIAARESARVAGGRLVQTPVVPVSRPHAVLTGLDSSALPPLGGYVVGTVKPSADTAIASPLGDPILATGRLGLGRVVVYSADLHSEWSDRLRAWNGFGQLFAQTIRWASRRVRDELLYATFVEDADTLRLVVDAQTREGALVNDLDVRAMVRSPSGATTTISLAATAPGLYQAAVATPERGAYVFAIAGTSGDRRIDSRIVRGFYWTGRREYRSHGVDRTVLTRIAELSGGRTLAANDDAFSVPRDSRFFDLRPWLTGAALALFLVEVLLLSRLDAAVGRRRRAKVATRAGMRAA